MHFRRSAERVCAWVGPAPHDALATLYRADVEIGALLLAVSEAFEELDSEPDVVREDNDLTVIGEERETARTSSRRS